MKRLVLALLLLLSALPHANAAVTAKVMTQLAQVDLLATGVVASNSQIAVFGNREKNGFIQIINGPILELTAGVESFVSAATTDAAGNFYIVGASANPIVGTLPPVAGVLNPDNVVSDPVSSNKGDAVNLIYWKVDSTGKLIDTQSMTMSNAVMPYSILVDANAITIGGTIYSNPGFTGFVTDWNSKPVFIGKGKTQVHAIARNSDGSITAVGQSGDKLLNTTLKGRVDGFLAKVVKGKFTAVQRSTESNASRAWMSSSPNLLLGGNVNTLAAVTKFNSNFLPTWTDRYPSIGSALTASVGKVHYSAFVSTGAIKALPSWKKKNAILVLSYDAKGAITAASFVNGTQLNGFLANSALGPIVLSAGFLYRA